MLTLVLAPFSVTGGKIMNSSQEFEFINRDLVGFDSKFLVEFAHSGSLDSLNGSGELCAGLACDSKGVLHIHVLDASKLNDFEGRSLTEQQVFVQRSGKVIFSAARCWSNRRFCESNRKTEKARCKSPRLMFVIKWPV